MLDGVHEIYKISSIFTLYFYFEPILSWRYIYFDGNDGWVDGCVRAVDRKCIHFMKFLADVEDMKYPFEDIL